MSATKTDATDLTPAETDATLPNANGGLVTPEFSPLYLDMNQIKNSSSFLRPLFSGLPDGMTLDKVRGKDYLGVHKRLLIALRESWGPTTEITFELLLRSLNTDHRALADELQCAPEQIIELQRIYVERAQQIMSVLGWKITTEVTEHSRVRTGDKYAGSYAVVKATVTAPYGVVTTGHKLECYEDFPDYLEKAETGAIGRALVKQGFGTEWADADESFDEGNRIVDTPVATRTGAAQAAAAAQTGAPVRTRTPQAPGQATGQAPAAAAAPKPAAPAAPKPVAPANAVALALASNATTGPVSTDTRKRFAACKDQYGADFMIWAIRQSGYAGGKYLDNVTEGQCIAFLDQLATVYHPAWQTGGQAEYEAAKAQASKATPQAAPAAPTALTTLLGADGQPLDPNAVIPEQANNPNGPTIATWARFKTIVTQKGGMRNADVSAALLAINDWKAKKQMVIQTFSQADVLAGIAALEQLPDA